MIQDSAILNQLRNVDRSMSHNMYTNIVNGLNPGVSVVCVVLRRTVVGD